MVQLQVSRFTSKGKTQIEVSLSWFYPALLMVHFDSDFKQLDLMDIVILQDLHVDFLITSWDGKTTFLLKNIPKYIDP